MNEEEKKQYMKEWRKSNPNYRRDYYNAHKDREKELSKEWNKNNKKKKLGISKKASSNYREQNIEKCEARSQISNAIKSKIITRPDNCEKCNRRTSRLQAHHKDYSKPLMVEWLCIGCHREVHK